MHSLSRTQRDNVIVALPFDYAQVDMDQGLVAARAAVWVSYVCLAINAICFFGGFNIFNIAQGLFRARPTTAQATSSSLSTRSPFHCGSTPPCNSSLAVLLLATS